MVTPRTLSAKDLKMPRNLVSLSQLSYGDNSCAHNISYGTERRRGKILLGNTERFISERECVHKVNPAYTSQTCGQCKHLNGGNRKTQSEFICLKC